MEDFSKYYTVEINGPKGWEVYTKCISKEDAQYDYDHLRAAGEYQVRLTTPAVN